jgi:hypothetical protein
MSKEHKKENKDAMSDAEVALAFQQFGFVHRGGSRPKPLNTRLGITNAAFAADDYVFRKACALAGVEPTPRQAGKYRSKRGKAYQFKGQANQ